MSINIGESKFTPQQMRHEVRAGTGIGKYFVGAIGVILGFAFAAAAASGVGAN